jgi:hypothetical protein
MLRYTPGGTFDSQAKRPRSFISRSLLLAHSFVLSTSDRFVSSEPVDSLIQTRMTIQTRALSLALVADWAALVAAGHLRGRGGAFFFGLAYVAWQKRDLSANLVVVCLANYGLLRMARASIVTTFHDPIICKTQTAKDHGAARFVSAPSMSFSRLHLDPEQNTR